MDFFFRKDDDAMCSILASKTLQKREHLNFRLKNGWLSLELLKKTKPTEDFLVSGLEHFLFFHRLGIMIPTDFHIFQRVGQPPTILLSIDYP